MRSDSPKCICAPNCKRRDGLWPKGGPVCGTDGVSYKSHCRLKKRSCRTRDQSLTVNYRGPCQSECIKRKWTTTRIFGPAVRVGAAGVAFDNRNASVWSGREPNLTFFFPFLPVRRSHYSFYLLSLRVIFPRTPLKTCFASSRSVLVLIGDAPT